LYPQEFFDYVVANAKLNGRGRLLDLGCGTGELAIPLAKYFEYVLGLDPDLGMLKEARKKQYALGINNISFNKGSSKNLEKVNGTFKLVTMGQSFHWMDEKTVLKSLYERLEPRGGVVIVGTSPIDQNRLMMQANKAVGTAIGKYLGPNRRAGKHIYTPTGENWETKLFPQSAFRKIEKRTYVIKVKRTAEQIVGNLFSMSFASRKLLGLQSEEFEKELTQQLKGISRNKSFVEQVQFIVYLLKK
jgi:ubiquinone/menaquinone biosynthesis C-methylase UbiE